MARARGAPRGVGFLMYGKIFTSIFDSTLAAEGGWLSTYVFMGMISLADKDGYVEMPSRALDSKVRPAQMTEAPHPLRAYRQAHGITQKALAERLGCSQGYIALIESRERGIKPATARIWGETLGLDPARLVWPDA